MEKICSLCKAGYSNEQEIPKALESQKNSSLDV